MLDNRKEKGIKELKQLKPYIQTINQSIALVGDGKLENMLRIYN